MRKQMPAASIFAVVVLVLVLVAVAGCGEEGNGGTSASQSGSSAAQGDSGAGSANSDSGSTGSPSSASGGAPTETKTVSKREFIQKGNAICQATIKKIVSEVSPVLGKAQAESEAAETAAEIRLASTVMGPALRTEIKEIQALGTPPGDEQQIEAIFDAIRGLSEIGEKNPEEMVRNKNLFTPAANLAERYGLSFCPYG